MAYSNKKRTGTFAEWLEEQNNGSNQSTTKTRENINSYGRNTQQTQTTTQSPRPGSFAEWQQKNSQTQTRPSYRPQTQTSTQTSTQTTTQNRPQERTSELNKLSSLASWAKQVRETTDEKTLKDAAGKSKEYKNYFEKNKDKYDAATLNKVQQLIGLAENEISHKTKKKNPFVTRSISESEMMGNLKLETAIMEQEEEEERQKKQAEYDKQSAVYEKLKGQKDFAENSKYKKSENPLLAENALYEYVNRNEDVKRFANEYGYTGATGDIGFSIDNDKTFLEQMSDDEIATFNYIDTTKGREASTEYLNHLRRQLTAKQREEATEFYEQMADEDPVATSIASAIMSPFKGTAYVGQLADLIATGEIDQNAKYNQAAYANTAVRNKVSQKVEEKYGEVGSFAYQTGMSMADMLVGMGFSGGAEPLMLGIMGAGAASDKVIESKDKGLSDAQAFAIGTIAGGAEIITEKVSIDTLLDNIGKSAGKALLKNMLAEGSEEVGSDLINWIADVAIAKDKSEWKQAIQEYMQQGYSESEAFGLAMGDQAKQMGLSFAGGAVSGGVFGGATTIPAVGSTVRDYFGRSNDSTVDYDSEMAEGRTASEESIQQEDKAREILKKIAKQKEMAENDDTDAAWDIEIENYESTQDATTKRTADEETTKQNEPIYEGLVKENAETNDSERYAEIDRIAARRAELQDQVDSIRRDPDNPRDFYNHRTGESVSEEEVTRLSSELEKANREYEEAVDNAPAPAVTELDDSKDESVLFSQFEEQESSMGEIGKNTFNEISSIVQEEAAGMNAEQAEIHSNEVMSNFNRGYSAGITGTEMKYGRLDTTADVALQAGYEAGLQDAKLNLIKKTANTTERIAPKRNESFAAFNSKEAGVVDTAELRSLMEQTDEYGNPRLKKETVQRFNSVAKMLGARVNFVEHLDENAVYNNKTGEVTISMDADLDKSMDFYLGHEFTHRLEKASPTSYKYLVDAVQGTMTADALEQAITGYQNMAKSHGIDFSREDAINEIVADHIGNLLDEDSTALDDFLRSHLGTKEGRTLVQKVRDFFRSIARKLNGNEQSKRYSAVEKRLTEALQMSYENVQQMLDERQAVREQKAADERRTERNVRNSLRSLATSAGLNMTLDSGGMVHYEYNGEEISEVTEEHIKNSGLGAIIKLARDNGNIKENEYKEQITAAKDLMNMIMHTQDPQLIWEYGGASLFSAIKSNSDGQYGTTVDFTTICKKTQEMVTAMSTAMKEKGRGLSKDEVAQLQRKVHESGANVPCPVCYVFSRWAGVGSILDGINDWQDKYENYTDEQLKKAMLQLNSETSEEKKARLAANDKLYQAYQAEIEKLQTWNKEQTNQLKDLDPENAELRKATIELNKEEIKKLKQKCTNMVNRMSAELAWLKNVRTTTKISKDGKITSFSTKAWDKEGKIDKDVLFDLDRGEEFAKRWPAAWKYRTTRGPSAGKAILPYSEMRLGDLITGPGKGGKFGSVMDGEFSADQKKKIVSAMAKTRAQNIIGGQRFQSTSDYRSEYALDYLQVFWEAQALGSNMQTYTKVVEFADIVAAVGGDCNLSVMPQGKGYLNGRLKFSSVTGMDIDAAIKASKMHDSVQLILVGINDEHIRLALDDSVDADGNSITGGSEIGFVIPWHASGNADAFIAELVKNLGESYTKSNYQDYSRVQEDHNDPNATADQVRRREIRQQILKGKKGSKKWTPSAGELEFLKGKNKDIRHRSFEDLLETERKALAGDPDALDDYESWSEGVLWNLYNNMWLDKNNDNYWWTNPFTGKRMPTRLNGSQAGSVMPHEYWNQTVDRAHAYINGFIFRSYCHNLGLLPRFTGNASDGKVDFGDFSDCAGYWKTLIDRPMYDNNGNYRAQNTINVSQLKQDMLKPEYAETNWSDYYTPAPDTARAERVGREFAKDLENGKQYSLRQRDTEYMDAVKRGDMETAQRMVDEAAKEAGYSSPLLWHGTYEKFTVFKPNEWLKEANGDNQIQGYFSEDRSYSEAYGETKPYYVKIENPLDFYDTSWDNTISGWKKWFKSKGVTNIKFDSGIFEDTLKGADYGDGKKYYSAFDIFDGATYWSGDGNLTERIKAAGYDGMRWDYDEKAWIPFINSNIKSADPVTYDDNGNVIPLSERFNERNEDIRYSIRKDSEGRELTAAQQEYFKDSKVVDKDGNLLVVYHGTPSGGFTVFRPASYFSSNKEYADVYQNPAASSIGFGKTADNPQTYEGYLNITKPFDTRDPEIRKIFEEQYYRKWGTGAPLSDKTGLPDWTDGLDLVEFIEENNLDFDGLMLDEGGVPDGQGGVIDRGISYVPLDSNQFKDINNTNPTKDADIRFSMRSPVEETKDLVAVHNVWKDGLSNMLKLGGFPMPSIAIVKASQGHNKYGDVTFVFGKDTIDPKKSKANKVYGGDAYTPVFPTIVKKIDNKVADNIRTKLTGIFGIQPYQQDLLNGLRLPSLDVDNISRQLQYNTPYEAYGKEPTFKLAYVMNEKGMQMEVPMQDGKLGNYGNDLWELLDDRMPDMSIDDINSGYEEIMEKYEPILRKAIYDYNMQKTKKMPESLKKHFQEQMDFSRVDSFIRNLRRYRDNGIPRVVDNAALEEKLNELVDENGYKKWINDLFSGIIEKEGIRNNKDMFTNSGTRRKWESLHDPVTLDSVVKVMKSQLDAGGNGLFGANPKGAAQKVYGSIADIKADSDRLQMLDEEEFKQIEGEAVQKMSDVCGDIARSNPKSFSNSFGAALDVGEYVAEIINKTRNRARIKKLLKDDYWLDVTEEQMDDLMDAIDSIANMPTGYFEAKPKRAVTFDEVRGIVVPNDISDELRSELNATGMNVFEYEAGNDEDRLAKINSIENVRFSLRGSTNIIDHAELVAENTKLQKRVENLEGEFHRNKGYKANKNSAKKALKTLMDDYGVDAAEVDMTADQFTELANKLHRDPKKAYQEVRDAATKLANSLILNSKEVVETDASIQEVKDMLRKTKLYVDPTTRSDIPDFNEVRKSYFGKLTLTYEPSNQSIDDAYSELSNMYPWLFPEEIMNSTDQLEEIMKVVDTIPYLEIDRYSEYDADTVDMVTNEVMNSLLGVLGVKNPDTFADRKYKEKTEYGEKIKSQYRDRIARIRQQRDAKIARIEQHNRDVRENARARKINSEARKKLLKLEKNLKNKKTTAFNKALIDQIMATLDETSAAISNRTLKNLSDLDWWVRTLKSQDEEYIVDSITREKLERFAKIQRSIEAAGYTLNEVLATGYGWDQFAALNGQTLEDVAKNEGWDKLDSLDIVRGLTEVLLALDTQIRNEKRTIDTEDRRDTFAQGMASIDAINNSYGLKSSAAKLLDKWIFTEVARPRTELLRICGYNEDAPLYQRFLDLTAGQRKMVDYSRRANERYFDRFINDKEFISQVSGKKAREIEITGEITKGNPITVKVTPDLLMSLYMHSLNDQNTRHMEMGGVTIPDIKLYKEGKIAKAYDNNAQKVTFTRTDIKKYAMNNLTPKELAFINSAQKYYKEMSQPEINAVSEKLLGYEIANVENYYRIVTDKNWARTNFDQLKMDGTIEGMGFTKERIEGANNPMELVGMISQVTNDIKAHSKYVGMAIPVRNFNKVYGISTKLIKNDGSNTLIKNGKPEPEVYSHYYSSVMNSIKKKWGDAGNNYIIKMLQDIQNPNTSMDKTYGPWLSKVRSNYAKAVLDLNAAVAIKQAASYPTAAAELGWEPLMKALTTFPKTKGKSAAFISQYSPLMRLRTEGYISQETGDILSQGKSLPKAANWIQMVDIGTVRLLWLASEYKVKADFPNLKYGTKEFYEKVGELHTTVIENTQPNYTELQRAQILRSDKEIVKMLNMFKTQPFQNMNILLEAFGNYRAKSIQYKNDPSDDNLKLKKAAGLRVRRAVSSQFMAAAVFAAMQFVWDLFRGRKDKYKDKEGEENLIGWMRGVGLNMVSSFAGMLPFGTTIAEWGENTIDQVSTALGGEAIFDQKFYGMDAGSSLEGINDILSGATSTIVDFIQIGKGLFNASEADEPIDWEKYIRDLTGNGTDMAQYFGVPVDNIMKSIKGVISSGLRISQGKYVGQYYTVRMDRDITSATKKYYWPILLDAYDHDPDQFEQLYNIMIKEKKFATKDYTAQQNVDKKIRDHVKELAKKGKEVASEFKDATDRAREEHGIDSDLYKAALEAHDANQNDKYDQDEIYAAIASMNLTDAQKEYLWSEKKYKKTFKEFDELQKNKNKPKTRSMPSEDFSTPQSRYMNLGDGSASIKRRGKSPDQQPVGNRRIGETKNAVKFAEEMDWILQNNPDFEYPESIAEFEAMLEEMGINPDEVSVPFYYQHGLDTLEEYRRLIGSYKK